MIQSYDRERDNNQKEARAGATSPVALHFCCSFWVLSPKSHTIPVACISASRSLLQAIDHPFDTQDASVQDPSGLPPFDSVRAQNIFHLLILVIFLALDKRVFLRSFSRAFVPRSFAVHASLPVAARAMVSFHK